MKKFVILILVVCIAGGAYLYLSKSDFDKLPKFLSFLRKQESISQPEEADAPAEEPDAPKEWKIPPEKAVTLHLKNNSSISGELVYETPEEVIILWKGGEIGFTRNEIEHVEYGKVVGEEKGLLFSRSTQEWPYKNDVVVQLTNLAVLDGEIAAVGPEVITVKYPIEGGGSIGQDIERAKIEKLLFKPVDNERSQKIEDMLSEIFPKMRIYYEGVFTIFTDSTSTWADRFKSELTSHMTECYFSFFDIMKNRKPNIQSFLVIFDSMIDFYIFGLSEGAVGVAGYFDPTNEVLYLPNFLGSELDNWIDQVALSEIREAIGGVEDWIKDRADDRYDIFIEGLGDEIKGKYVKYYNFIKNWHRRKTYNVLRHEGTHELFHNWGIQMIVVAKKEISEEEVEKKKELMKLKEEDFEKNQKEIKKLLHKIWSQREETLESFEEEAANSWFVEGMATYSGTSPVGEVNDRWLYYYQKAAKENALLPLEQLTVYKMGSFGGVAQESAYYAYGESWAFTHFLMNNYKDGFMKYVDRMARETPEDDEDILWLTEAIGKDIREIEKEFLAYMANFEEAEDPDFNIKQYDYYINTFY